MGAQEVDYFVAIYFGVVDGAAVETVAVAG
jgi:hypothetical protein